MIVQTIVALLLAEPTVAALVQDRIYPVQSPDAPRYPFVVVLKPSGVGNYDLDGDVGIEDARVQIDLYVDSGYADMLTLRNAVRRFLSGYKGGGGTGNPCVIQACLCINDFDLNETSTERAGPRIRRRVLEFRIWNTEV